jgi:hypothetical protein
MPESEIEERQKYVNPVLLEDSVRGVMASAGRLLDYERYLYGLERLKTRDESLPAAVEQHVSSSIQGNLADAETMGRQILELTTELDQVGAFEALFSSLDERIEPGSVPEVIKEVSPVLEEWLEQRGLPSSTWRRATQYADREDVGARIDWEDVGARAEAGAIVVFRGDRTIGVISATPSAEMDAASFVARAYGLPPAIPRADDGDRPLRLSASEMAEATVRALVTSYRWRARRTALDGVEVLPGGWWIVVIIIIVVILVVAGASITILCSIGSITDKGICDVGIALLIAGFILGLLILGPATSGPRDGDDPDYPGEDDPDPSG